MPVKKKPAKKPAAKKPAVVDYKKKYEALKRAAEDVSEEISSGQIECLCDDGRQAIGDLRRAAEITVKNCGAEVRIKIHNSPIPIKEETDEKWDILLNGKKLNRDDFSVSVEQDSEEG